jgi:hypothetical protein
MQPVLASDLGGAGEDPPVRFRLEIDFLLRFNDFKLLFFMLHRFKLDFYN